MQSKKFKFAACLSTDSYRDRPLPPLPPSASSHYLPSVHPSMEISLTRTPSGDSDETLWTTASSGSSSPTRKRNLSDFIMFGRKPGGYERRSWISDDRATVVGKFVLKDIDTDSLPEDKSDNEASSLASEEDGSFKDPNRTTMRGGMPHHPFDVEDVPYMQSFSPTVLDSDKWTHRLFNQLNPTRTPTFCGFRGHPEKVLDLGCGEGYWVRDAASHWKSANVIGIDLIDVQSIWPHRAQEVMPKNASFIRLNILKHRLPFPDNTFDLVRMANLTLVVPYWSWDFVLQEVERVLVSGGRLELIDDQLFFPRVPSIAEIRGYQVPSPLRTAFPPSPLCKQDGQDDELDVRVYGSWPMIRPPRQASRGYAPAIGDPSPPQHAPAQNHKRSQLEVEYEEDTRSATWLERTFHRMLVDKYAYAPHVYEYIMYPLEEYFEGGSVEKTHEFRLGLPSRELMDNERWQQDRERLKGHTRRPRYSESDVHIGVKTGKVSYESGSKAMRVLLGDGNSRPRKAKPYQPPGLILLPASLNQSIDFSPEELEMHACKNMHLLLSCGDALTTYACEQANEDEKLKITREEMQDTLFDYDRFRRKRFNWPMDPPDLQMRGDLSDSSPISPFLPIIRSVTPPPLGRGRSDSHIPRTKPDRAIEVRVIRVYSATKAMKPTGQSPMI